MTTVAVETFIAAPAASVFEAITDIENFPSTSPGVIAVEFLGAQHKGAGTRFRETREMGNARQSFELELTQYDPIGLRARFVCESHGTVWDTTMQVHEVPKGSRVRFEMEAKSPAWFKRVMNFVMQGLFRHSMRKHVAQLKHHCETNVGR